MSFQNIAELNNVNTFVVNNVGLFTDQDKSDITANCAVLENIMRKTLGNDAATPVNAHNPSHKEIVAVIDWIRDNPEISQYDKTCAQDSINIIAKIVKKSIGNQNIAGAGSI